MKHSNFQLLLTSALLILASGVNADNRLVYPPADNTQIYEYPPVNFGTAPANSVIPYPPVSNVSNYNQPLKFNSNRPSQNNGYQNRMPQQNMMPMNRMNPYQANNGNPFGNNMPFGNNSGNNFNPFSGGNMPFGNNSGNSFNPFSGGNMPFGNNSGNNFNPFSGGNMPFGNNSGNNFNPFSSGNNSNNPMSNMFGSNNNNNSMPFFGNTRDKNRKKAWGDERNIWPDFYTDFTDDAWDTVTSGPRDLGRMPGGWRFPHISTPDPVTVSDAITNQFPPMVEEGGNMVDPSDWGLFDDK